MRAPQFWWILGLRGLLLIIVSILFIAQPGSTIVAAVQVYGVFAIVDGVLALVGSMTQWRNNPGRWQQLAEAAVLILLGVFLVSRLGTIVASATLAILMPVYVAALALVAGIARIVGAYNAREEIERPWLIIASGVVSCGFGVYVLFNPGLGFQTFALALGIFGIIAGILLLIGAWFLKQIADKVHNGLTPQA